MFEPGTFFQVTDRQLDARTHRRRASGADAHRDYSHAMWEYKIERATFSKDLEGRLNTWGARGWEVIAMTGISGAVTLTGNKIFVIMKRQVDLEQMQQDVSNMRQWFIDCSGIEQLEVLGREFGFDQVDIALVALRDHCAKRGAMVDDPAAALSLALRWITGSRYEPEVAVAAACDRLEFR